MTALKIQLDILETKFNSIFKKHKYTIYDINEPILNNKYGIINIVKMNLDNKKGPCLIVVPGYSMDSMVTIFEKLLEGFNYIKDIYSSLYIVNWGQTIKDLSSNITKGLTDQDEMYQLNEDFRIDLASVLDKIIRSMDLKCDITILGKSAGGGVSIYMAKMDTSHNIKTLLLCCPGTIGGGKPLKDRKDLKIALSWNEDDNKIPFQTYTKFEEDFVEQNNNYKIFLYKKGGHELNTLFLKENMLNLQHMSSLLSPYYEYVKEGVKEYELRVNDNKRQNMKEGDMWLFKHANIKSDNIIKTIIVERKEYKTFKEGVLDTGYKKLLPNVNSTDDAINIYENFDNGNYKIDALEYGVVRFRLKII